MHDKLPNDTVMPREVSWRMTSTAPGSSGASVTILALSTLPQTRLTSSIPLERLGTISDSSCAPFFSLLMNGPSRWTPSTTTHRTDTCVPVLRKCAPIPHEYWDQSVSQSSGIQAGDTSHKHSIRLPLLPATLAVIFPATKHHCFLVCTKIYCLVTEADVCGAQSHSMTVELPTVKTATSGLQIQCFNR